MNPIGAKGFAIAVGILLSTICLRVASESMDSENSAAVVVNVKEFSAKGDGTTDDTLAFNGALKALGEKGGGTLLVPSGTYLVGELKVGSGTTLKGLGVPRPSLRNVRTHKKYPDLTGRSYRRAAERRSQCNHRIHNSPGPLG